MRNLALMFVLAGVAVALLAAGDGKPPVSTFTDKRDGKVYKIVKIGSQTWMAQNLNYAAEGSVCYDNNADSCAKYGRLYDWNTAMNGASSSRVSPSGVQGVCPAGWHLPAAGWKRLVDYVGVWKTAGTQLKSETGWNSCRGIVPASVDTYGFSALPGGHGYTAGSDCGDFGGAGDDGYWWSATEVDDENAWYLNMCCDYEGINMKSIVKTEHFSVRCVQDEEGEQ